jgi:hypothetical protein
MSIVTLKKKTQAQYNNMSVNSQHGFSLNGTRRSQGYIGQTSLSRSLPRTLIRDGVPMGHGGCCGTFKIFPVVTSAVTSLNDSNIIKPSSINTLGMIETKYNQPLYHEAVVKPDNNQNINTQSQYTKNLAKYTIKCANLLKASDVSLNEAACKACYNYDPFFKKKIQKFTKPISNYVPISQGEYLLKLDNKCSENDKVFVPSAYCSGPLPGPPASY